jgi:motility quorum-sensing regulator / GCU-specific mRNA interferase toxin
MDNQLAKYNLSGYFQCMEKRTAHCRLAVIKAMVRAGKVHTTRSAREGAAALQIDFDQMIAVVLALTPADFFKSMTTHANHKLWQDVYHPTLSIGRVYLKLTVIDDVLIVSFKEL